MKKKNTVNFLLLYLSVSIAMIGVLGIGFVAAYSNSELPEPIEFTVATMDIRGDGTLYLTAEEFESPRFYVIDFDDKRAVDRSVRAGDKISVWVYDYNDRDKEFHIVELHKDGERVFSVIPRGNGARKAYIGFGIALGVGVVLSAVFTVRLVKSTRKKTNAEEEHE